jgi:membrane protein implicated in regulation of membrane protease activity
MSFLFRGQRSNEEVILIVRHHPLVLLHPFLLSVAIFLVPFVGYVFLSLGTILFWLIFICLAYGLFHAIVAYWAWYNSMILLSNERVIVCRQHGLWRKEISECTLGNIQQISHEMNGILHNTFSYGNMEISLGGGNSSIKIYNMPNPYDLQQEILRVAAREGYAVEGGE